ncbi:MAG: hypothetical protein IJ685_10885 [Selenomonadaceae bacterium]|nr:hypothetical protein [Selenomonadaceae bacterium]
MQKLFLTGALTACLLFTGCGEDVASNTVDENIDEDSSENIGEKLGRKIDFNAKAMEKVRTYGSGTELVAEEILPQENTATKRNIDWKNAPHFNNFDSLVEYLNDCKKNLQTYQPVICDDFVPDSEKIPDIRAIQWLSWTDYGNGRILYEITNYPGERVAWAYTHNDTSFLSNEEKNLYNVAVQIVNDAKKFSSDLLYQELYLHDAITSRAEYYTENPQPKLARFQSALGALIDGKANCQGYSDAFYMLATMCGLQADKVCGYGDDEAHTWNTISFGNESYFVDVTWDDGKCVFNNVPYNYYIYFNTPTNVLGSDHRWYTAHAPQNLQTNPDGRNFYHTKAYDSSGGKYFGAWSLTAEDALGHIAYRIANQGYKISWIEAPYNETYTNVNNALNYLLNDLKNRGWGGHVNMNVQWRGGKYMYFTVEATPK